MYGLFKEIVSNSDYQTINGYSVRRNRLWPNLTYYSEICLERLTKAMKRIGKIDLRVEI
jgi:hypothetical protein